MHFNLKNHNTSGITFKDDGQIISSKIEEGKIINSNIAFKSPYKLQIRASKVIAKKRYVNKKTVSFDVTVTLLDAIKESSIIYNDMMDKLSAPVVLDANAILDPTMKFVDLLEMYLDYKVDDHNNKPNKTPFNKNKHQLHANKWISSIFNTSINKVTPMAITRIKANMYKKYKNTNGQYVDSLDSNSKKIPLSERSKVSINELINPCYRFYNDNRTTKAYVNSPALNKGSLSDNSRSFDLSYDDIEVLFKKLYRCDVEPYRSIFVWLMHGYRINSVLTLRYEDIVDDVITIQAQNNKARIAMKYYLNDRLKATLDSDKTKGLIFSTDADKKINSPYVTTIFKSIISFDITLHQIRNCIVVYLKNRCDVSDEVCAVILGHKQSKSITQHYGKIEAMKIDEKLNLMLDKIFKDNVPTKVNPKLDKLRAIYPTVSNEKLYQIIKDNNIDEKLAQLQIMFPNKTIEQLKGFLDD